MFFIFENLYTSSRPRGGDWLEDDLLGWAKKIEVVVSCLTKSEEEVLKLSNEELLCKKLGIEFVRFEISDREVPDSLAKFEEQIRELYSTMLERPIVVHCRMGIGRSSLVAASLGVVNGRSGLEMFEIISNARGLKVPDTIQQINFVKNFEGRYHS